LSTPESTTAQPYARVDFIPQSGILDLASAVKKVTAVKTARAGTPAIAVLFLTLLRVVKERFLKKQRLFSVLFTSDAMEVRIVFSKKRMTTLKLTFVQQFDV
jgi:hypothetical protein